MANLREESQGGDQRILCRRVDVLSQRDASKVCARLTFARLRQCGFELVDTQMLTEHTESLGAFEVSRDDYLDLLRDAIGKEAAEF